MPDKKDRRLRQNRYSPEEAATMRRQAANTPHDPAQPSFIGETAQPDPVNGREPTPLSEIEMFFTGIASIESERPLVDYGLPHLGVRGLHFLDWGGGDIRLAYTNAAGEAQLLNADQAADLGQLLAMCSHHMRQLSGEGEE